MTDNLMSLSDDSLLRYYEGLREHVEADLKSGVRFMGGRQAAGDYAAHRNSSARIERRADLVAQRWRWIKVKNRSTKALSA
jgi:hypothetical protein